MYIFSSLLSDPSISLSCIFYIDCAEKCFWLNVSEPLISDLKCLYQNILIAALLSLINIVTDFLNRSDCCVVCNKWFYLRHDLILYLLVFKKNEINLLKNTLWCFILDWLNLFEWFTYIFLSFCKFISVFYIGKNLRAIW